MRKRQIMQNASEDSRPVTGPLGAKQQEAVDGPSDKQDMSYFVCTSCNQKFLDTKLYFYEVKSNRCLWCTKFPRSKQRNIDTI